MRNSIYIIIRFYDNPLTNQLEGGTPDLDYHHHIINDIIVVVFHIVVVVIIFFLHKS
jgi:hypothetical protein